MLNSKKIIIKHNIDKDIIDFIGSNFNKIILFTQEKIKDSSNAIIEMFISNYQANIILLDDGESSKSIDSAMRSITQLAQLSANKETLLIAYGGGSVTDHVGFVSSIFKRGIQYINIPTTLIGIIDASIGGKTALNIGNVKNQIGTFYQPSKIFIDLDLLDKMSSEIIDDGLGEMFKYSFIKGEDLLNDFKDYLNSKDSNLFYQLINECCKIKLDIVAIDERDENIRNTLNLGHTFGHAIESDSKNKVSHGIAVTNGLLIASFLSFKKNYLKETDFNKIQLIAQSLIKEKYKINNVDKFVNYMLSDKKNNNNKIGIIIIEKIGQVDLKYFTSQEIRSFIRSYNEYISN